ncbi:U3 small nucleolar RNA-associated protein 6 [Pelomyxa schiedti]|nr:U3 small nucleolar RNA-associated protein 6 [Pelomyxa schiedti]
MDAVTLHIEKFQEIVQSLLHFDVLKLGEAKIAIKQCTDHEYRVKRYDVKVSFYVDYIQFLVDLLNLMKARLDLNGINHSVIAPLKGFTSNIFTKAISRFPTHMELVEEQIKFNQMEMPRKVSRLLARILQRFPTQEKYWLHAIAWECNENKNFENARILLQRAVRTNPKSSVLWVEFIRFELMVLSYYTKVTIATPYAELLVVPITIYKHSLEAVPQLDHRKAILGMLEEFPTSELVPMVIESIRKDFPGDTKALLTVSKWFCTHESLESGLDVFEQEIMRSPHRTELWAEYANMILTINLPQAEKLRLSAWIFQRAGKSRALSAELYETWLKMLQFPEQIELGLNICAVACEAHPSSQILWMHRITLLLHKYNEEQQNFGDDNPEQIYDIFKLAISKVYPDGPTNLLWLHYISLCILHGQPFESIFSLFKEGVTQLASTGQSREDLSRYKEDLITKVYQAFGIEEARQLYSWCLLTHCGLIVFMCMISIESKEMGPSGDKQRLFAVFEDALERYGTSESELWYDYFKLLQNSGEIAKSGLIFQRAKRTLTDPAEFILICAKDDS